MIENECLMTTTRVSKAEYKSSTEESRINGEYIEMSSKCKLQYIYAKAWRELVFITPRLADVRKCSTLSKDNLEYWILLITFKHNPLVRWEQTFIRKIKPLVCQTLLKYD